MVAQEARLEIASKFEVAIANISNLTVFIG